MNREHGFTLIELMVVVAILAILTAVAIPLYTDYIDTAEEGVLTQNVSTMRVFQEDYRLREGTYLAGQWDPNGTQDLEATLGWSPNQDGEDVTYTVSGADANGYTVTATDGDTGKSVTIEVP